MRRLMESWNSYLQESEDMNRVSKAIMIGDVEGFNDGKVLILKRHKSHITEDFPYEWDLPGGHIQEGEGEKDALVRELTEEIGFAPLLVPDWFLLSGNTRFFIIQDWEGTFELGAEHEDYEWINPSEVGEYYLGKVYTHAIEQVFKG